MKKNNYLMSFDEDQDIDKDGQNEQQKKFDKFEVQGGLSRGFFVQNDHQDYKIIESKVEDSSNQNSPNGTENVTRYRQKRNKNQPKKLEPLKSEVSQVIKVQSIYQFQNNQQEKKEQNELQNIPTNQFREKNKKQQKKKLLGKQTELNQIQNVNEIDVVVSSEQNIPNKQEQNEIITFMKSKQFTDQGFDRQNILDKNLPQNYGLRLKLVRQNSGLNMFWPEFHLFFQNDDYFLMSGKKTSSKPTSTFIISNKIGNYEQQSPYYLGKIKSNLSGNVFNIHGTGINPAKAQSLNIFPRQVIATVVYNINILEIGKPRDFSLYVKIPQHRYYDLKGVKIYDQETPLNQLYKFPENHDKIIVFENRKPIWKEDIKGYMLNFDGRVKRPSVKNFIVQQKGHETSKALLFGRVGNQVFNLDIYHPLAAGIAFAVALTSFDSRIISQ